MTKNLQLEFWGEELHITCNFTNWIDNVNVSDWNLGFIIVWLVPVWWWGLGHSEEHLAVFLGTDHMLSVIQTTTTTTHVPGSLLSGPGETMIRTDSCLSPLNKYTSNLFPGAVTPD